jgi:surface protein
MASMFMGCSKFNRDLSAWDVSNVKNMAGMFGNCHQFNQSLNSWDVRNVTTMEYMFDRCENFNQPLNSWNVSNVNNMLAMFYRCTHFNQPLNSWNVSNVTNMLVMFAMCINFNQSLNDWNVSNVTNMLGMFGNCGRFNQPLNNWIIGRDTDTRDMFHNCPITEENKPPALRLRVDPYQIHRESSKINYSKLISFLRDKVEHHTVPSDEDFGKVYLHNTVNSILENINETKKLKEDFEKIMHSRLRSAEYKHFSEKVREAIFYSLEYVQKQPTKFQTMYIKTYIDDCLNAYDGEYGMTCLGGALERFVYSFVPACAVDENNEEYKVLAAIILANPKIMIQEYIHDWYKEHNNAGVHKFPEGTTTDKKKASLKAYLLEKFPKEEKLIDEKIAEMEIAIGFDDDVFMYGGRKIRKRIEKYFSMRKGAKTLKTKSR